MVERTHREQRQEERDLREDHRTVRGADRHAWRGDVLERERDSRQSDGARSHRGEPREGAEPADAGLRIVSYGERRRADQAADPDTGGRLVKGADPEEPAKIPTAPPVAGQGAPGGPPSGRGGAGPPSARARRLAQRERRAG